MNAIRCVAVRALVWGIAALAGPFVSTLPADEPRPRLIVLTDIGGDPDDQQSLIRLLVYSNEFDIEGLIATGSGTLGELKEKITQPQLIREQLDAYERVRPNLIKHADGFPLAEQLRSVLKTGNPLRGREHLGEGRDTEASQWIVARGDVPDHRPLNIAIWGGQTDFAQALWRVRHDRGADGLRKFLGGLRVFDIDDQDRLQEWLYAEFPDLFYVLSKAPKGADKREGAYRGMYLGGDQSLTSRDWLNQHVRCQHGPLGELYPAETWTAPNPHGALKEGDTSSWFYFLPNGLSDPAHPEWGGWGGRFKSAGGGLWRDVADKVGEETHRRASVWRWRPAYQNEFAARMDWCVASEASGANHAPSAALNGDVSRSIRTLRGRPGETVTLSAAGSRDPDNNALRYEWAVYPEAGTFGGHVDLTTSTGESTSMVVPEAPRGATIHVVLSVVDDGRPPLTSYRRAVIEVSR